MELIQKQTQQLSQYQLQSVKLLQMSALELETFISDLAQENPLVEFNEQDTPAEPCVHTEELLQRIHWLEDNDRQNYYLQVLDKDMIDPLATAKTSGGLEDTLQRFLLQQIDTLPLKKELSQAMRLWAACLDENGYLSLSPEELACRSGQSLPLLKQALSILHTLDPAGVGADGLSQCLELQLLRLGETGPALAIVRHHLELLARRRYRTIAKALGVSIEEIQQAGELIRSLEPRPGAPFQQDGHVPYIQPDVFVYAEGDSIQIRSKNGERTPFRINSYYRSLLRQTDDQDVRDYLIDKLHQAETIKRSICQREATILRCVRIIVERQRAFFLMGPQALTPLRLLDLAQELGLHESTVSRAIHGKYLQCSQGIFPLSYFFSRSATNTPAQNTIGNMAARILLRQLIDGENKVHPLSDQKLCEEMARLGCAISRRTVAKYREEMNLPAAAFRKAIQRT